MGCHNTCKQVLMLHLCCCQHSYRVIWGDGASELAVVITTPGTERKCCPVALFALGRKELWRSSRPRGLSVQF